MPTFEIVCVGEHFTHSVRVGGFRSGVILMKGFTVLANFVNIKMIKLQLNTTTGRSLQVLICFQYVPFKGRQIVLTEAHSWTAVLNCSYSSSVFSWTVVIASMIHNWLMRRNVLTEAQSWKSVLNCSYSSCFQSNRSNCFNDSQLIEATECAYRSTFIDNCLKIHFLVLFSVAY